MLNFKNKTMIKIEAKIIADSINPQGDRLTSILVTFPRIILAEVNTHRMLSKNTSSSRAIPFKKMVETVQNDPFVPIAWQKRHKGMQGTEYFTDNEMPNSMEPNWFVNRWLEARDEAVRKSTRLSDAGITKQLCNRLLEPFMWTTMLITGSKEGWDNFFSLRLPEYHLKGIPTVDEALSLSSETITLVGKSKKELLKEINQIDNDSYTGFKTIINNYTDLDWLQINKGQAEIHMMTLSEKIYDAIQESVPKKLKENEWHIPFRDKMNDEKIEDLLRGPYRASYIRHEGDLQQAKVEIATARCARLSYMTFDGIIDYEKDIKLHDSLLESHHMSPFEHCARAMSTDEYFEFAKGKLLVKDGYGDGDSLEQDLDNSTEGWCKNFKGFISYRHIIETQK